MREFHIVAAVDREGGIGLNNAIPWNCPKDLKDFKRLTVGVDRRHEPGKRNCVIMGRNTWESLPAKARPLPDRFNVVLTSRATVMDFGGDTNCVALAPSLDAALEMCAERPDIRDVFVIGGGTVYTEAIVHPRCTNLHVTSIDGVYGCDTFFPTIPEHFSAGVCKD